MKTRIGILTIGQAPRDDVVPEMIPFLGSEVEIIQKGALDGLSRSRIDRLAPPDGQISLCTRLSDGSQAVVSKEMILDSVQSKIRMLDRDGVDLVLLLCTGAFPEFQSRSLVIQAQKVVDHTLAALLEPDHELGLMIPLPEQEKSMVAALKTITPRLHTVAASPYGPLSEVEKAAETLKSVSPDLVVLYCMGFSKVHSRSVRRIVSKPVIAAGSLVARIMAELIGASPAQP